MNQNTIPHNQIDDTESDLQVEIGLKAINMTTQVRINGTEIFHVVAQEVSDIPSGGSVTLINRAHSLFKNDDANHDPLFIDTAILKHSENTVSIEYTALPHADYAGVSLRIRTIKDLSNDTTENRVSIFEVLEDTKKEGHIEHTFLLPQN